MKKRYIFNITCSIVFLAFVFNCTNHTTLSRHKASLTSYSWEKEDTLKLPASFRMYENLNRCFHQRHSLYAVYPQNYGGSYVDENGDFVVRIVRRKVPAEISYVPKGAVIKDCKYSYQQLIEVVDYLSLYPLLHHKDVFHSYLFYYIDEKLNKVVVKLAAYSDKAVEMFKKEVMDDDIVCII